jgi:uncharacterized RDD family membrane protein YckC
MKCPKCGYLGFETTDRCRNCQYDFSLASPVAQADLTLHGAERDDESPGDFDLKPIKKQTDKLSATSLDLDRLFGDPTGSAGATGSTGSEDSAPIIEIFDDEAVAPFRPQAPQKPTAPLESPQPLEPREPVELVEAVEPVEPAEPVDRPDALPFDDGPMVPPPAARPPLAVRRSTSEVPRNRPRTTRPARAFDFEPGAASKSGDAARDASETVASLMETPSLGARVGAGVIDAMLLVGIDVAVLYLTLRVTGLDNSLGDIVILPPVPFIGFLALIGFGYMAAFTVAGGQTIGKMLFRLRVIGDDGRPVDAAGGVIRALGCMLVPVTLGLSYLPAVFTSDHRAVHDRLAGTRVVRE